MKCSKCGRKVITAVVVCNECRAEPENKQTAHGRWAQIPINVTNDKYGTNRYNVRIKCTSCGFVTSTDLRYSYCPNCGAKMDGVCRESGGEND